MPEYIDLSKNPQLAKQIMNTTRDKVITALGRGMGKALARIEGDAKRECPTDQGRLRASITHEVITDNGQIKGRVGTNVEYAPYVHEGTGIYALNGQGRQTPWMYKDRKGIMHLTRGIRPREFIRKAAETNRSKVADDIVGELRSIHD